MEGLAHNTSQQILAPGSGGRPVSGSMQPVAINSVAAAYSADTRGVRFKSVSMPASALANALTPPQRKSALMEAAASAHAQSVAQHGDAADVGGTTGPHSSSMHAALPASLLYAMPQVLPHPGPTSAQQTMRSSNSPTNARLNGARPRVGIATGEDLPHSVSFSDSVCDSPNTHGTDPHPFDQDDLAASPMYTPNGGKLY